MKLERHVGGLSIARKTNYLTRRGWAQRSDGWANASTEEPVSLARAIHHQLTFDLTGRLKALGWRVTGYSQRGYAQLQDPTNGSSCSLPAALRRQARRERRPVAELTYSLFLAGLLDDEPPG